MRIGIDAKWFFNGHPSGRAVIQNLVKTIIAEADQYPGIHFVIYLDEAFRERSPFEDAAAISFRYIWSKNNLLANLFTLTKSGHADRLDALLFQNFPSVSARFKRISFIHDVLYEDHPQFFGWKERLYFLPLKYLTRRCEHIITISETEKKRVARFNYQQPENISVAYHGVSDEFKPLTKFPPAFIDGVKAAYALPEKFILYVGRLNIRKNIRCLVEAMSRIDDSGIRLVIVGAINHKHDQGIEDQILKLGLQDRIKFTGFVKQEHLPAVYALATLFCFPSFAEGFGLPPLEAMASGVPVLASSATCLPEVCGDNAMYFDPRSPAELASGINKINSDNSLRDALIKKGLDHSSTFKWTKSLRKIIDVTTMVVAPTGIPAATHPNRIA